MKFLELHERLRGETWRRIDQGVLSPSLLARQTGLAQPHISNFLHKKRRLSLPALDRILLAQALSIEELASSGSSDLSPPEGMDQQSMDIVPIVSSTTAMNAPLVPPRAILDALRLPAGWLTSFPVRRAVSRRSWERFVSVRISGQQASPMDPLLRAGSVVVIDRHYNSLALCKPPQPNLYAVRVGAQLLFRHVAFDANRLILRPRALDYPIELLELAPRETPSDFLIGRICLCISEV